MQLLNAPSRSEVNTAHSHGSWLDIGVPSLHNIFLTSKFKAFCWVACAITSVPIHLLFNSTVFRVAQRESSFHLTIATENFLHGGAYFLPGANQTISYSNNTDGDPELSPIIHPYNISNYWPTPYTDNVATVVAGANHWTRLEKHECWSEYVNCHGLQKYRNLLLIIDRSEGWKLQSREDLLKSQSRRWHRRGPSDELNDLFYHSPCSMSATILAVFGTAGRQKNYTQPRSWDITDNSTVGYCLAEPMATTCYTALSQPLLLAITISIVVKTITAAIVTIALTRQNRKPLITLGDFIESFLEHPMQSTPELCPISYTNIIDIPGSETVIAMPISRRWPNLQTQRIFVVPRFLWLTNLVIFLVILITALFFIIVGSMAGLGVHGDFLQSDDNAFSSLPVTTTSGVLIANSPQLILSISYLIVNNLFTRLQMASEWGKFSTTHHPLRVTNPRGEQTSTYRLQLPYKYSVPLIGSSILLHWLLSNSLYTFTSTGDYWISKSNGQSSDIIVLLGCSIPSLITVTALFVILNLGAPLLGQKSLPSGIVHPGSNSLALASACHRLATTVPYTRQKSGLPIGITRKFPWHLATQEPSAEKYFLLRGSLKRTTEKNTAISTEPDIRLATSTQNSDYSAEASAITDPLLTNPDLEPQGQDEMPVKLVERKLRWGVIDVVTGFENENVGDPVQVQYLGFGTEEDGVTLPRTDVLYA